MYGLVIEQRFHQNIPIIYQDVKIMSTYYNKKILNITSIYGILINLNIKSHHKILDNKK